MILSYKNGLKLSKNLAKVMANRRISVKELARTSGVPASTINEWLWGRSPNIAGVYRVAKTLNVSIESLAFGEEPSFHMQL